MEIPESLLTQMVDLTAAVENDAREIAAVRERFESTTQSLATDLARARAAVSGASQAIIEAEGQVEDAIKTHVDPILKQAAADIQNVTVLVQNLGGATDVVDQVTEQVRDLKDSIPARFGALLDLLGDDFGGLNEVLTEVRDEAEKVRDTFRDSLDGSIQELNELLESNVIQPLQQKSDELKEEWEELIDTAVEQHISELFDQAADQIKAPLEEALDQITEVVQAEFEDLRLELTGGDVEGQKTREELEKCIALLEEALEPLKSAFDSFRGLASTVGVSI